MDSGGDEVKDSGDQDGARPRMLSKQLDQEGILCEKLCRIKNERLCYLSTVSVRRNEIDVLLLSEENVQLVKKTLPSFLAAVELFKQSHLAYLLNLQDEISIKRCQEQLNSVFTCKRLLSKRVG